MTDPSDIFRGIVDFLAFLVYVITQSFNSLIKLVTPAAYEPVKTVKGETILITGAGSGLGRLLAVKLASHQATVVVWDVNEKGLEETVRLVRAIGGRIYSYKCDLTKREEVYRIAEVTKREVGEVTILINNAGVVSGYHLLDTPDHLIQRTFDVNALALFWTAKAFLPDMIKNNRGHVVTIASMAGYTPCVKLVDYCASKHAAVGFDESLRLELLSQGITGVKTTVVCPFFIASTGMFNDVKAKAPSLSVDEVANSVVLGILREDQLVMLPRHFRYTFWLRWIFPWSIFAKVMTTLVQDAVPTPTKA